MEPVVNVFHYEPSFLFPVNRLYIGKVKLVFCQIRDESYHKKCIFILQNGYASSINYIETIAKQIQKKIIDDLNLNIVTDFDIYIVNPNRYMGGQRDLTRVDLNSDMSDVKWRDVDYTDLGFSKDHIVNALNEYLADIYSPYQMFNSRMYSEDFRDITVYAEPQSYYLRCLLAAVKKQQYKDKLFQIRLKQICLEFIAAIDTEEEVTQKYVQSQVSAYKSRDSHNGDCYDQIYLTLQHELATDPEFGKSGWLDN